VGDYAVQGKKSVINRFEEMEAIGVALLEITPEMVEVATSLWVRLLKTLHGRMHKSLRDYYELGQQKVSCFPSAGSLFLLRLLGHIFPTSDYRHPVTTPAFLFMGEALTACPVTTTWDLKAGLFLCSLLLEFTTKAKRVVPEVTAFLSTAAAALVQPSSPVGTTTLTTFDPTFIKGLKGAWRENVAKDCSLSLPLLKKREEEEGEDVARVVVSALAVVLDLSKRWVIVMDRWYWL